MHSDSNRSGAGLFPCRLPVLPLSLHGRLLVVTRPALSLKTILNVISVMAELLKMAVKISPAKCQADWKTGKGISDSGRYRVRREKLHEQITGISALDAAMQIKPSAKLADAVQVPSLCLTSIPGMTRRD